MFPSSINVSTPYTNTMLEFQSETQVSESDLIIQTPCCMISRQVLNLLVSTTRMSVWITFGYWEREHFAMSSLLERHPRGHFITLPGILGHLRGHFVMFYLPGKASKRAPGGELKEWGVGVGQLSTKVRKYSFDFCTLVSPKNQGSTSCTCGV